MKWLTADLAELTGGHGGRAALILIAAHVVLPLFTFALWALGLLPVFDDLRWIPIVVVSLYAAVMFVGLFVRFGAWGTARSFFRDVGEEYMETFSPRVGFGLGWLRWFMQIVAAFIILFPLVMTWANTRWWELAGTEELDALPARAAAIPIPDDWELQRTSASETGIPEFMFQTTSTSSAPEGNVERVYDVPTRYTADDLKKWLSSSKWEKKPDGNAFGEIQLEKCTSQPDRCDARLKTGHQPEYFIHATAYKNTSADYPSSVKVRLTYEKYEPPDWDVSEATIERAREIPIPSDWIRYKVKAQTTRGDESFSRYYRVPESFTRDDLESWFKGSMWTDSDSGKPFGELDVNSCREIGEDDGYLCTAYVAGTDRTANNSYTGPVEVVKASLDSNHTIRITLERNG